MEHRCSLNIHERYWCVSSKEPYISSKELYISAKEPYILRTQVFSQYTWDIEVWRQVSRQKSPISLQKSPVSPEKSPIFSYMWAKRCICERLTTDIDVWGQVSRQKSPISPQKSHRPSLNRTQETIYVYIRKNTLIYTWENVHKHIYIRHKYTNTKILHKETYIKGPI